jgi:hypothetical protein
MAGVVVVMLGLVVLPLVSLVWGSVSADGRLTLAHFHEALSSRLTSRPSAIPSSSACGQRSSASPSACPSPGR